LSDIRADTISDSAGTGPVTLTKQSAAKGWVNLTQDGTQAIQDSFNVSSINDIDVGRSSMTWTNSMSNSVYAASFAAWDMIYYLTVSCGHSKSTTGYIYACSRAGTTIKEDCDEVHLLAHGDLA